MCNYRLPDRTEALRLLTILSNVQSLAEDRTIALARLTELIKILLLEE